jgi:hypothetical protein
MKEQKVLGGHIDYRRASRCRADVVQMALINRGKEILVEHT